MGEGGGQVIRTAITLSCILGKSLKIFNARAKRDKPGLQEQHVTSLFVASCVCNGSLTNCVVGSTEFTFIPGKIFNGDFVFDLKSAGSAVLVLQTIIPILWFAPGPSTIRIYGGTHNGLSPSFDFYKEVFCPLMPIEINCELINYGFYPSCRGEIFVKVDPCIKRQFPIMIMEKGNLLFKTLLMFHSKAENVCQKINDRIQPELRCNPVEVETIGKGLPVLTAFYKYSNINEMINVYHQKDIPKTLKNFTNQINKYQNSNIPVGEYLADQLLLPLALIGGGSYKTSVISKHFETNALIIHMFLGPKIYINKKEDSYEIHIV